MQYNFLWIPDLDKSSCGKPPRPHTAMKMKKYKFLHLRYFAIVLSLLSSTTYLFQTYVSLKNHAEID